MLSSIITWAVKIISVLPNLITGMEQLWSGQPKSGAQKWLGIEQALSGSIELAANEVAKLAPAGTKPETISTGIAQFTKDVNDSFVKLMNDLGIFSTSK